MDHRSLIDGAGLLLDAVGHWPSFREAEVVKLMLDRDDREVGGPTLETWLRVFESSDGAGPIGSRRHARVHLRFRGIVSLCIREWNERNALFGLRIEDAREYEIEGVDFEVMFDGICGMDAAFGCRRVEVVSAEIREPGRSESGEDRSVAAPPL